MNDQCQTGWLLGLPGKDDPEGIRNRPQLFRYPVQPGRGYTRCRRRATHRVSSGCVHEHVLTWLVCARCARAVERSTREKRPGHCIECKVLGHECAVLVSAEEGIPEAVSA